MEHGNFKDFGKRGGRPSCVTSDPEGMPFCIIAVLGKGSIWAPAAVAEASIWASVDLRGASDVAAPVSGKSAVSDFVAVVCHGNKGGSENRCQFVFLEKNA